MARKERTNWKCVWMCQDLKMTQVSMIWVFQSMCIEHIGIECPPWSMMVRVQGVLSVYATTTCTRSKYPATCCTCSSVDHSTGTVTTPDSPHGFSKVANWLSSIWAFMK